MDRQAEIIDRRRTMAAQEAWGKFSVRNANRLAELEAEERRANGQIDWGKRAYCFLFWYGVLAGIWGVSFSPYSCYDEPWHLDIGGQ